MEILNTNSKFTKLADALSALKLNISDNPRGTDKGDCKTYVRGFYEAEFGPRREVKNRVLEIGVRSGASLALWANYFTDAEIIGADVEEVGTSVGPMREYLQYPCVKFFCGDAYTRGFAESLPGKFTVLIDDGPHTLDSQKRFLELYLPKLAAGGVLIIEDIQCNYRDCYQLVKVLPPGGKYIFEAYDFRKQTRTGDDFLFVVRHNTSGESAVARKMFFWGKRFESLFLAAYRRIIAPFRSKQPKCDKSESKLS